MKKSTILIKTKIMSYDLAGARVPVLRYYIFVDGHRFGTYCNSLSDLEEAIICALIMENPDTNYDVVFDPLRIGSFNYYLPLISK